jgi:hypothetical protein
MTLFSKRQDSFSKRQVSSARINAVLELTLQVRAILDVDDDAVVSISEHDCGEPECGGLQTVILVLRPGQPTKAVRIAKPSESITRNDLSEALVPPAADARPVTPRSETA